MTKFAVVAVGCFLLALVASVFFVKYARPPYGIATGMSPQQVERRMRRPADIRYRVVDIGAGGEVQFAREWCSERVFVTFRANKVAKVEHEWLPECVERVVALVLRTTPCNRHAVVSEVSTRV